MRTGGTVGWADRAGLFRACNTAWTGAWEVADVTTVTTLTWLVVAGVTMEGVIGAVVATNVVGV